MHHPSRLHRLIKRPPQRFTTQLQHQFLQGNGGKWGNGEMGSWGNGGLGDWGDEMGDWGDEMGG